MIEPLVTISEAAADLRISERTLRRIIRAGKSALRIVQVSPGRIALKRTDIERYKGQQVREPVACGPAGRPKPKGGKRTARGSNVISFTELMARQSAARATRDDRV